ncbi:MAG: hypothetical protein AAF514_02510, partial [Verrucomicrobiota bacterium]
FKMERKLMFMPVIISMISLFSVDADGQSRVYTNSDGKEIEADYVSSSDTHVTLKLKRNGKDYTFPIAQLSKADQAYVVEVRASLEKEEQQKASAEARIAAAAAAAEKISGFAEENLGKKVGDGECWTLADEAFRAAGVQRPGSDSRVWGREVNWKKEKARPGDILELESAHFSNGARSAEKHTAIIIKCRRKGVLTVCHQNWGGKEVTRMEFNLKGMTSGRATIYRYE